MPIYEYRCDDCGHELEAIQKMSENPLTDCPACGESALKKKISAVAFRLKGSGWYETDFKTGDKKKNLVKDDASPSATTKTDSGTGGGDKKDSGGAGKDNGSTSKSQASSSAAA